MHVLCIYCRVYLPICTYTVFLTSSGQVSAFGVVYALYKRYAWLYSRLYHCYTTVCAYCILYQVYQWYSHRIWHISRWKVCYMPQSVPPHTFLDGIQAYTSYTICLYQAILAYQNAILLYRNAIPPYISCYHILGALSRNICIFKRISPSCQCLQRGGEVQSLLPTKAEYLMHIIYT